MIQKKVQGKIVSFDLKNNDDSNFIKCKLKLMHDGQSKNKTQFTKEVMINCVEKSIRNTPILCHVYKDEEGNYNIGNHDIDFDLEKNDNGEFKINIIHYEKPVGFIPESTEIFTEEEDGRTYIYAYGLLWKHYMDKLNDLLLNQDCVSNISTELKCIDSNVNDEKILNIENFEVLGTTIISAETGMHNTIGEFYFSNDDKVSIEDMKKAYELEQKGGENEDMPKKEKDKKIEDVVETFALSSEDIIGQIYSILSKMVTNEVDRWGDVYQKHQYWLYSFIPDDKIAILEDCTGETPCFVGVQYNIQGDIVTLDFDSKKPYICEWRPMNTEDKPIEFSKKEDLKEHLIQKYDNLKNEYDNLKQESDKLNETIESMKDYDELKEFKLQSDKEKYEKEVEEITKKFGLDCKEVSELKVKVLNYEIELKEYEKELGYLFAINKIAEEKIKMYDKKEPEGKEEMPQIDDSSINEPYGGIFSILDK